MRLFGKNNFILVFCLLCFAIQPVITRAGSDRTITTEQWQKLTGDKAFNYKNEKEKARKPAEYKENAFSKFVRTFIELLASGAGLALAWVLVICIVVFILYKLFSGNGSIMFSKRKKAMNDPGTQAQEEEDIAATNWEALLHKAITNNDMRAAVRYSYMRLLQLLQQHELIQYRNDKTNYEYYTELSETGYKQPFKQLSRQYEYAWYGHYNLSPAVYNEYIALFNNLKKQLGA